MAEGNGHQVIHERQQHLIVSWNTRKESYQTHSHPPPENWKTLFPSSKQKVKPGRDTMARPLPGVSLIYNKVNCPWPLA